mgnify:CR=1 FL=1
MSNIIRVMMMTVTLYKNTSDARCISKNLSEGIEITCREFDNGSIMNPRLIVEYNSEYANKNYCFISDFGRYYYINNIEITNGKRCIINCSVDVLMTYAGSIRNVNATIVRRQGSGTTTIPDSSITLKTAPNVQDYIFTGNADVFTSGAYILNVFGGGA